MLVHDAEPPEFWWRRCQIFVAEHDSAVRHTNYAGDRFQQRRFSRTGRPNHDAVGTLRHIEADVGELKAACSSAHVLERDHSALSLQRIAAAESAQRSEWHEREQHEHRGDG